jgi:hypothetical protein
VKIKGFRHQRAAIHFELKLIRQSQARNKFNGIKADIDKLIAYMPNEQNYIRDFIMVFGSRFNDTNIADFKKSY